MPELVLSLVMARNAKPFVQAACVCENAIQDANGAFSLIRLVDTYTLEIPDNFPKDFKPAVQLTAFIAIKAGDVQGNFEIGLNLRDPKGASKEIRKWPVVLTGGINGANLVMKFGMPAADFGLYWFDVMWGQEVLTSIPFKLQLAPKQPPGAQ